MWSKHIDMLIISWMVQVRSMQKRIWIRVTLFVVAGWVKIDAVQWSCIRRKAYARVFKFAWRNRWIFWKKQKSSAEKKISKLAADGQKKWANYADRGLAGAQICPQKLARCHSTKLETKKMTAFFKISFVSFEIQKRRASLLLFTFDRATSLRGSRR